MPSKLTVKHRDLQLSSALDLEWMKRKHERKKMSQRLASKNKEERRQATFF